MSAGDEGRDEGMGRVNRGADPAWKRACAIAIVEAAKTFPQLTTDDVLLLIDPDVSTHDMRALGPMMTNAAKDGVIEKARMMPVTCARPSNHSRPLTVWRSLIYKRREVA